MSIPRLLMSVVVHVIASASSLTVADEKSTKSSAPLPASAEVKLTAGTWKDVEDLVSQHKGKIVIVDVWSTSCLPCMSEFPKLVKLHEAHSDDIVCVSFNVDYVGIKNKPAEHYRARVEEFLKKEKAAFTNFLSSMESDKVFQTLELSSIPAVYVFDRKGMMAKRFDDSLFEDGEEDAFTYEKDINPFVEELLKNK